MDKISQFKQISKENAELYARKNEDYCDSFGETYRECGIESAVTRLQDKMNRAKQLAKNPAKVKDESMIDTLRDLSNYAIMTIIEIQNS